MAGDSPSEKDPVPTQEIGPGMEAQFGQAMQVDDDEVETPVEQATTAEGSIDRPVQSGSQGAATASAEKELINRAPRTARYYKELKKRRKAEKIAAGTWVERPYISPRSKEGSADAKTPKRQRSDGSTPSGSGGKNPLKKPRGDTAMSLAERLSSIKVAVVPKDFPERLLTEEDILELSSALIAQMRPLSDGCLPGFSGTARLESGVMVLLCCNPETRGWLEQTVAKCNPWKGATLEVVEARKVLKISKVITRFPPPFDKMKVEDVLVRIHQHDLKLSTKDWRIINARTIGPQGRTVILGLNERDLEEIKKRNLKVRLGLGQIQFQVIDRKLERDAKYAEGDPGEPTA